MLSVAAPGITTFRVDDAGAATPSPPMLLPGRGPRHLAYSPDGRFAYVVHERPIRVTSYRVDPETGALSGVADLPALPEGAVAKNALAAAEIAVTPSGRFVIASVRDFSKDPPEADRNGLAVFAADSATGALTWVEWVRTGGVSPRGFVVDPTETFVFVANELSRTLVAFWIDRSTGRLRPAGAPVQLEGNAIGIALVTLPR